MNRLERALVELDKDLREQGARWALVGGLAMAARGVGRTTLDIDVAVAVAGDREAEQLVRALRARGYSQARDPREDRASGHLAMLGLFSRGSDPEQRVVIDLLFALAGIESEVVAHAELLEVATDLALPVAVSGDLLAMKTLAGRPRDLEDAEHLARLASAEDLAQARDAAQLVARRRPADSDLPERLEELLTRALRGAVEPS